ncbi:MAG: hypothetical protein MMC33_006243 [Icmadophila ericetorum]|nr:hypothetical protein [Icmadophila ericetorum]
MVWPFSSSSPELHPPTNGDPLRDLDPSLREFLENESPVKYKPTSEQPPRPRAPTPELSTPSTTPPSTSKPPPTLYPDGRYSHIWKNYRPLAEIDAENKSDQEKLLDVIDGYKERRAQIGRAALENCALELEAQSDCWRGKTGGVRGRMTMCRQETRKLERCYVMQSRFLKALGYLSTYDRPPEVDEEIQMHADTLYHRMIAQEAAVEAAKSASEPLPTFPPLLSTPLPRSQKPAVELYLDQAQKSTQPSISVEELKPAAKERFKERLKGLSEQEREVEEQAIRAEIAAGERLGRQIEGLREEEERQREKRRETGRRTFGDWVTDVFRVGK